MVRLVFGVHVFSSSILVQLVHVQPRSQKRDPGNEVGPQDRQVLVSRTTPTAFRFCRVRLVLVVPLSFFTLVQLALVLREG